MGRGDRAVGGVDVVEVGDGRRDRGEPGDDRAAVGGGMAVPTVGAGEEGAELDRFDLVERHERHEAGVVETAEHRRLVTETSGVVAFDGQQAAAGADDGVVAHDRGLVASGRGPCNLK